MLEGCSVVIRKAENLSRNTGWVECVVRESYGPECNALLKNLCVLPRRCCKRATELQKRLGIHVVLGEPGEHIIHMDFALLQGVRCGTLHSLQVSATMLSAILLWLSQCLSLLERDDWMRCVEVTRSKMSWASL
jgi:hypothetical protein